MKLLGVLPLAILILSGCATSSFNKNSQAWEDLRRSETFQKEKATFYSRLGDRKFCWNVGLDEFMSPYAKPDSKCIYPASKLIVQYEDGNKVLGQRFQQMKILQVVPKGFVTSSTSHANDQIIFIHRTDEKDFVDGSFLDETQNFKIYEYAGTYSYNTLAGSKTVHSFRKFNKQIGEVRKDLKYYDPLREFMIENQLWKNLGDLPKD